ncbi:MAG: hypothetical protein A2821_00815 [Candidatus Magasanikbacteria bacterium RIFCSPHIGHO2_01_FULL_41_23]|uniref:Undecaprenyl-diphosphatase n=1 Tax=Candidatus Magasanikbacteria bacterium RIFCSPLOWO2_01_FULL_40_15 TaxID=1798686 RepID=A0A1F6N139_9BACT|nr:MAG: hypothetical protein A2821_00815 [Candidatus Magasanikbacteria bacterium RIFCSPHIGHO2_01_FULL_41_23]OGH74716.1 MAG: hypothetical protein A3F22_02170 [Candidatus Magasanikbacteria bacterium RIFCSPHIGHO2_12_FULL_41_16]OGH77430.1 MAG: hypothetical protein A2983_01870 [Candidatus Magasanikbacteria bacterium RIFCSPLOWO2_01_FULL_40_15]
MTSVQAIVLGLIQGLTEFLPVSSSGHLIFIPKLFGWTDQGVAFDLVMHLGTLLAVIIYFRKKLGQLILAIFSRGQELRADRKIGWMIMVSALPAGVVGLFLQTNERNALLVGINLIVWGIVLGVADYYANKKKQVPEIRPSLTKSQVGTENIFDKNIKSIMVMSFAQVLAFLPGTSRSGITMTAGLFSGLSRSAAAEFSFLMSVPITALAGLDALYKLYNVNFNGEEINIMLLGFVVAFLSGLVAISGLLKIVKKWSFMPFVVYRVIIGVFILWYLI